MFNWNKKEKPLLGLQGSGGGLGYLAPKGVGTQMTASGGTTNDYTESGNPYRSHTFLSAGTFSIPALGTGVIGEAIDCMVVGGGGGGGDNGAARGGAGGMRVFTDVPVTTGSFGVTIGNGGAGDPYPGSSGTGTKGSNSTFALTPFGPIIAEGGGFGGSYPGNDGGPGGSGGAGAGHGGPAAAGASNASPDGISPTTQGNAGGAGGGGPIGSGGGGGAGGAGVAGSGDAGGAGGVGLQNTFRTGSAIYYAGGGGGGGSPAGASTVNTGGGGAGAGTAPTINGTANTGGGGGGSGTNPYAGGTGGSGIVVVRYRLNPA